MMEAWLIIVLGHHWDHFEILATFLTIISGEIIAFLIDCELAIGVGLIQ